MLLRTVQLLLNWRVLSHHACFCLIISSSYPGCTARCSAPRRSRRPISWRNIGITCWMRKCKGGCYICARVSRAPCQCSGARRRWDKCIPATSAIDAVVYRRYVTCAHQFYTSNSFLAIPRIKLRKRSASDTLRPLFAELPSALEKSSAQLHRSEGKEILRLLCLLLKSTIGWAGKQEDPSDLPIVKVRT